MFSGKSKEKGNYFIHILKVVELSFRSSRSVRNEKTPLSLKDYIFLKLKSKCLMFQEDYVLCFYVFYLPRQ